MIEVPLTRAGTQVAVALVDDEDAWVLVHRWRLSSHGYPETGHSKRLHRLLMAPPDGLEVDHISGNKLDNRRSNLRLCSHAENTQNVRTTKGAYRGVYFDRRSGKWYGQVKVRGQKHSTPVRTCREEARRDVEALRARLLPFAAEVVC
jgi:hypothetical protein